MDIHDFFPSISHQRIYKFFRRLEWAPDVARLVTRLTTAEGHLPQGYPTSPRLAACCLETAGVRIHNFCRQQGVAVTIYVDDVILSADHRARNVVHLLKRALREAGFRVNPQKIREMLRPGRQEILGLVVNEKTNVPREYIRDLHHRLMAAKTRIRLGETVSESERQYLKGRIRYLRTVNPHRATRCERLFRDIQWDPGEDA